MVVGLYFRTQLLVKLPLVVPMISAIRVIDRDFNLCGSQNIKVLTLRCEMIGELRFNMMVIRLLVK